jgi:hypothetical protein
MAEAASTSVKPARINLGFDAADVECIAISGGSGRVLPGQFQRDDRCDAAAGREHALLPAVSVGCGKVVRVLGDEDYGEGYGMFAVDAILFNHE